MTEILYLLLCFVSPIAVFVFIMLFAFRGKHSDGLTIEEMKSSEKDIQHRRREILEKAMVEREDGTHYLDPYILAKELKLEIVEDNDIPVRNRGLLDKPRNPAQYNGTIRYREKPDDKYASNFDIVHEIMHYIYDVGVGKVVAQSFPRVHHGYRRGHKEQKIDYYAAAAAIPINELRSILQTKGNTPNKELITDLMEMYRQPKETVARRVNEVRVLA